MKQHSTTLQCKRKIKQKKMNRKAQRNMTTQTIQTVIIAPTDLLCKCQMHSHTDRQNTAQNTVPSTQYNTSEWRKRHCDKQD